MLVSLMNDTPGGFVRMQVLPSGKIIPLYFNDGFLKLVSMSYDELMALYGKDAMAGVHPTDIEVVSSAVGQILEQGEARSREYRLLSGRGGYIWTMFFGRMIKTDTGEVFLNIYYMDMSQSDKSDDQRRELVENLPCGAGLYEFDGENLTTIYINSRYRELVGRTKVAGVHENVIDMIHPDDRMPLLKELKNAIAQKRTANYDTRLLYGDGTYRSFKITANTAGQPDGKMIVYTTYNPISDEERAYSETLTAAFAAMMRFSKNIMFVKDRNLRYVCVSSVFARLCGLENEADAIGKTDYELMERSLADAYSEVDHRLMATGIPVTDYIERLPTKDKALHYASTSKYLLYDPSGEAIGIYGIGRDITKDREAYAQLKLLTDSILGGVATYCLTKDSVSILYLNDTFSDFFGYGRKEFDARVEENALFMVCKEDMPIVERQINALLSGEDTADCTYRVETKNNGKRWVNLKGRIYERHNDTTIVNAVIFDVTNRAEMEERLRINEEEIRLSLSKMGKMTFLLDVPLRQLTLPEEYAHSHGLPQVITGVPEAFKALSAVYGEPGEAEGFFNEIYSGSKNAEAEIFVRCGNNFSAWEKASAVTIFNDEGHPVKAVITIEDTTLMHVKDMENEALKKNERILGLIAAHSGRAIFRYDVKAKIAYPVAYSGGSEQPGITESGNPKSLLENNKILPESVDDYQTLFKNIDDGVPEAVTKIHVVGRSGKPCWLDMRYTLIYDEGNTVDSAVISILDITEEHEKELVYERYKQNVASRKANEKTLYFDADLTADLIENIGGSLPGTLFPPAGCRHSKAVENGLKLLDEAQRPRAAEFFSREHLLTAFSDGVRHLSEQWCIGAEGAAKWFNSDIQMILDPYSVHIRAYISLNDITDEKADALKLQKQAETDGMTGLYNRITAERLIKQRLQSSIRCALLIVDLDDLKTINDTYGHAGGDEALRYIASSMRRQLRRTDIVARIGGDEFLAFLDGGGDEDALKLTLTSLLRRLSMVRLGKNKDIKVSASIGAAIGKRNDTFKELYEQADKALYYVKRNGKNDFAFYTPEMGEGKYEFKRNSAYAGLNTKLLGHEELQSVFDVFSKAYSLVLLANLTLDSYNVLKNATAFDSEIFTRTSYNDLVEYTASVLPQNERDDFIAALSQKALLHAMEEGTGRLTYTGPSLFGENAQTEISLFSPRMSKDIYAVIAVRQ